MNLKRDMPTCSFTILQQYAWSSTYCPVHKQAIGIYMRVQILDFCAGYVGRGETNVANASMASPCQCHTVSGCGAQN